jgi:serine carboxypeptidase-like clade 4
MQLRAWCLLLVVLVAHGSVLAGGEHAFAQARGLGQEYPSAVSLCGENLAKETGTLNGLYYVFYESSAKRLDAPVLLWLSGGPGCSGIIALLFENGPCSFDDEADSISFNPYSWTRLANMIYLDQPRGTGYSGIVNGITQPWSLGGAANDMHGFLQAFFLRHQELKANDLYIFGESYAGHYVPDLAARLLEDRTLPTLKGIAIGNGVVSTTAWVESMIPYLKSNDYGYDLLGGSAEVLQYHLDHFKASIASCRGQTQGAAGENVRRPVTNGASLECADALQRLNDLDGEASSTVWRAGRNVYDMRRECHLDDALRLCYRFSRLKAFVNSPAVRAYFDEVPREWELCTSGALSELAPMDKLEESEANVARALTHGVRVLVYGGDADMVVNWLSQDSWTRALDWEHQTAFQSANFSDQVFGGRRIGRVRTSHGLSFMKVYGAGHVRTAIHSIASLPLTFRSL